MASYTGLYQTIQLIISQDFQKTCNGKPIGEIVSFEDQHVFFPCEMDI